MLDLNQQYNFQRVGCYHYTNVQFGLSGRTRICNPRLPKSVRYHCATLRYGVSDRIRTYSAQRQQIYSLPQLSSSGDDTFGASNWNRTSIARLQIASFTVKL